MYPIARDKYHHSRTTFQYSLCSIPSLIRCTMACVVILVNSSNTDLVLWTSLGTDIKGPSILKQESVFFSGPIPINTIWAYWAVSVKDVLEYNAKYSWQYDPMSFETARTLTFRKADGTLVRGTGSCAREIVYEII
jgi:hypothetical protein